MTSSSGPAHPADCEVFAQVLDLVGRRWLPLILLAGAEGARRFGEYRRAVTGISDRVLSQRLRELADHGLVVREVVPTTPVQVTYRPTRRGLDLLDSLRPLIAWGRAHSVTGHRASA
ncbi:winged helix-turn-helix transcriptional regulator [Streptomonospora nanhaiensis]|uniref:DNA-binding HxlR family transcriptional regulator n=1 Tax=Streptomonospora nanhaiensis TaxID=1323731 RepID=A0A853BV66_9ACTN|nr:helix-turn-helix domain-containing protein [Streptomonospora nanhaiensis]MBV2365422.1 helix-turn-helix transcriptional regulator [Streptomonospora nanhaiensis]MBX9390840.1 helix-turn-helix transcriptional regulator [Streptomonospora nanhaiensis]NYI98983.1 DNA-binding HxlR family transcriptional regulator [Streptomonospora nanhaiensis]